MKFAGKTFGVALAISLAGTVGAFASTIDLTSNSGYTQTATSASGSVDGVSWTITPVPAAGPLTYTAFDCNCTAGSMPGGGWPIRMTVLASSMTRSALKPKA